MELKFIDGLNSQPEVKAYAAPLGCPTRKDPCWSSVKQKVNQEAFLLKLKSVNNLPDISIPPEGIHNIISGTVNLINYILQRVATQPVTTLLFLDKSAREGAHVFRVLWDELRRNGKIDDIDRPNIRFVNIGREDDGKYSSYAAARLFSAQYRDIDFQDDGVLIVDEIIETGASANKTMSHILSTFGSQSVAIAQFAEIPDFYIPGANFNGMWDCEPTDQLQTYFSSVPEDALVFLSYVCNNMYSSEYYNSTLNVVKNQPPSAALQGIVDFFIAHSIAKTVAFSDFFTRYSELFTEIGFDNQQAQTVFDALGEITFFIKKEMIFDYFKSIGGFMVLNVPKINDRKQSLYFRKYMTLVAESVVDHITVS